MTDIILQKTTDYRPSHDTEAWMLSLGGNDFATMTEEDLIRLGAMIDEILSEE